jgi:hypothetical protein
VKRDADREGQTLTSIVSKYPFSEHWKRKLSRRYISISASTADVKDEDFEELLDGMTPAIYRSFSNLPSNELLMKLAAIFASIHSCPEREISKRAKQGLVEIGFPRAGRGRPKGRLQHHTLRIFVEFAEQAIAETAIFQKKESARASCGRNWAAKFRNTLRADGWPTESFGLIIRCSPRLFAKHLAAEEYECEITQVSRALQTGATRS